MFRQTTFHHGNVSTWGLFGTRDFRHGDFSAPEHFGTRIFRHLGCSDTCTFRHRFFSARGLFGTGIFRHGDFRHLEFSWLEFLNPQKLFTLVDIDKDLRLVLENIFCLGILERDSREFPYIEGVLAVNPASSLYLCKWGQKTATKNLAIPSAENSCTENSPC